MNMPVFLRTRSRCARVSHSTGGGNRSPPEVGSRDSVAPPVVVAEEEDDEEDDCAASSRASIDFAEADCLLLTLPSPRRQARAVRPRPAKRATAPDVRAVVKRAMEFLSPIRLSVARGVSRGWRDAGGSDTLWEPLLREAFPGGSGKLGDWLTTRLGLAGDVCYALYRYRARLQPGFLARLRPDPEPVEYALDGYSVLVEIEVLRDSPAGYVVYADIRPLTLEPWKPVGPYNAANLENLYDNDSEDEDDERPMRICVELGRITAVPRGDLCDLRLSLMLIRRRDGQCMTLCGDSRIIDITAPVPTFTTGAVGRTIQLLGAGHIVRLDSTLWSAYAPTADGACYHHGDEGAEKVGDPAPGADVLDIGALSYEFHPSRGAIRSDWADTLPNIAEFWDKLGEWHALDGADSDAESLGDSESAPGYWG